MKPSEARKCVKKQLNRGKLVKSEKEGKVQLATPVVKPILRKKCTTQKQKVKVAPVAKKNKGGAKVRVEEKIVCTKKEEVEEEEEQDEDDCCAKPCQKPLGE